jgi:signal transduction histidine kinase
MMVILGQRGTGREFNTYLLDVDRNNIKEYFVTYYAENGSWQKVTYALPSLYSNLNIATDVSKPPPFVLTDPSFQVVVGGGMYNPGDILLLNDQAVSQPIVVGQSVVGYLDVRQPVPRPGPVEPAFLTRVNRLFIETGLIAIAIALVFGFLFSRFITRPLRELTSAAREVSNGNLDQQVKVRSTDELGELARVFNEMTARLKQAMDSRKQMTADIAHELRTPISVILGHAEGIHDGVLEPNEETIEIIREEAIRLEHLVGDLRTLALTDSGELKLVRGQFPPSKLIDNVRDLFQFHANARGISLELEVEPGLPNVWMDTNRMMQVFSNLMDNAIRSTPTGGTIRLSAHQLDGMVQFGVHDTGNGIPKTDLERVFDRLYRTDQARVRDKGGSGLGLTIAKSIVEQHGGTIWAESEAGQGTSIQIRLPVAGEELYS